MRDVLLHILGAAIMMVPAFLSSTPLLAGWFLAVVVSAFWFVREAMQDYEKHGEFKGKWSNWKLAEALAPCVTAGLCVIGATVWRLV